MQSADKSESNKKLEPSEDKNKFVELDDESRPPETLLRFCFRALQFFSDFSPVTWLCRTLTLSFMCAPRLAMYRQ